MLPRIKYRNPALPIEISRHKENLGPSILEIYTNLKPSTASPETPSNTPSTSTNSAPTEDAPASNTSAKPTYTIDLRMVQESEILAQLIARTGATVLKATPEEKAELAEIEEFKERSEKDRVEVRDKLAAKRREEEMLKLARGEMVVAT
jgi:large subunit ribosomal protein MRP49